MSGNKGRGSSSSNMLRDGMRMGTDQGGLACALDTIEAKEEWSVMVTLVSSNAV